MHFAKVICNCRPLPVFAALTLLGLCAGNTPAQRNTSNPAREVVRSIQRRDMDQMLQYKLLPASREENAARFMAMKQIGEDFHELQSLNNKMMAEAWAQKQLNYGFVSDMISRIRGRAARLKGNLNLPPPAHAEKPQATEPITNEASFRESLLTLDRTIMSFVTNPLFQKPNTIDAEQGAKARRDLEVVMDLTISIKKSASRLSKEHTTP
ncbi:MAG TPA: hypothetical protein VJT50_00800 [Pyrinomonadaceae bacterium]|nr:hypothetical protein [Pyrinomonadaceae bacterium]